METKIIVLCAFLALAVLAGSVSAVTESIGVEDYVVDFVYNQDDVAPGETFRLEVTVSNEAGETRDNIEISLDLEDPFDEVGDDVKTIGTLKDGEERTVSFRIEVDDDAKDEEYEIDFKIKDDKIEDRDELVIDVESNEAELIVGDIRSLPTIIAPDTEDIRLTLSIENIGSGDAEFVRGKLKLPEGFSASNSYSDIVNLGTINEGWDKEATFYIDSDENIGSGRHEGILELEYESDDEMRTVNLVFDLPVKGRPQFKIVNVETDPKKIVQGGEGSLRISVLNVGDEEGEETSIRVFENSDHPFEYNEKTNFIGDLGPGEEGVGIVSFDVDGNGDVKDYLVRIQIRTLSNGNVLVEEKSVLVSVGAREDRNWFVYVVGFTVLLVIVLIWLLVRSGKR